MLVTGSRRSNTFVENGGHLVSFTPSSNSTSTKFNGKDYDKTHTIPSRTIAQFSTTSSPTLPQTVNQPYSHQPTVPSATSATRPLRPLNHPINSTFTLKDASNIMKAWRNNPGLSLDIDKELMTAGLIRPTHEMSVTAQPYQLLDILVSSNDTAQTMTQKAIEIGLFSKVHYENFNKSTLEQHVACFYQLLVRMFYPYDISHGLSYHPCILVMYPNLLEHHNQRFKTNEEIAVNVVYLEHDSFSKQDAFMSSVRQFCLLFVQVFSQGKMQPPENNRFNNRKIDKLYQIAYQINKLFIEETQPSTCGIAIEFKKLCNEIASSIGERCDINISDMFYIEDKPSEKVTLAQYILKHGKQQISIHHPAMSKIPLRLLTAQILQYGINSFSVYEVVLFLAFTESQHLLVEITDVIDTSVLQALNSNNTRDWLNQHLSSINISRQNTYLINLLVTSMRLLNTYKESTTRDMMISWVEALSPKELHYKTSEYALLVYCVATTPNFSNILQLAKLTMVSKENLKKEEFLLALNLFERCEAANLTSLSQVLLEYHPVFSKSKTPNVYKLGCDSCQQTFFCADVDKKELIINERNFSFQEVQSSSTQILHRENLMLFHCSADQQDLCWSCVSNLSFLHRREENFNCLKDNQDIFSIVSQERGDRSEAVNYLERSTQKIKLTTLDNNTTILGHYTDSFRSLLKYNNNRDEFQFTELLMFIILTEGEISFRKVQQLSEQLEPHFDARKFMTVLTSIEPKDLAAVIAPLASDSLIHWLCRQYEGFQKLNKLANNSPVLVNNWLNIATQYQFLLQSGFTPYNLGQCLVTAYHSYPNLFERFSLDFSLDFNWDYLHKINLFLASNNSEFRYSSAPELAAKYYNHYVANGLPKTKVGCTCDNCKRVIFEIDYTHDNIKEKNTHDLVIVHKANDLEDYCVRCAESKLHIPPYNENALPSPQRVPTTSEVYYPPRNIDTQYTRLMADVDAEYEQPKGIHYPPSWNRVHPHINRTTLNHSSLGNSTPPVLPPSMRQGTYPNELNNNGLDYNNSEHEVPPLMPQPETIYYGDEADIAKTCEICCNTFNNDSCERVSYKVNELAGTQDVGHQNKICFECFERVLETGICPFTRAEITQYRTESNPKYIDVTKR